MVSDIVKWRLDIHDWRHGFVLDGFPRNALQAEFFLENYDIDAVIAIELPEEAAIARMQSRRLCSSCGLDYNLIQLRPQVAEVCDNCGGRLVTRADDTPEAIRARLRDYREKTQPILGRSCAAVIESESALAREAWDGSILQTIPASKAVNAR